MSSPQPATMVITCPHCGTRYELARTAIGAAGREVQCAHCQKAWQVTPGMPHSAIVENDLQFEDIAELVMDENFANEERKLQAKHAAAREAAAKREADERAATELAHQHTLDEIKRAITPKAGAGAGEVVKLDPRQQRKKERAFFRRQISTNNQLPIAKLRRSARIVGVVTLAALVGGGVTFRTAVVTQFPSLAGLYGAVGLPVNIVGLDFRNLRTLKSLQQGADVLVVDADIFTMSSAEVKVPPVIVTLIGANGSAIYQWSVAPKASELEPGEVVQFESMVTAPPAGAERVKLSFGGGSAGQTAAVAPVQNTNPGDRL